MEAQQWFESQPGRTSQMQNVLDRSIFRHTSVQQYVEALSSRVACGCQVLHSCGVVPCWQGAVPGARSLARRACGVLACGNRGVGRLVAGCRTLQRKRCQSARGCFRSRDCISKHSGGSACQEFVSGDGQLAGLLASMRSVGRVVVLPRAVASSDLDSYVAPR